MFKVSHTALIVLSGLVWLVVGCALLPLGVNILLDAAHHISFVNRPILDFFALFLGDHESAMLVLLTVCLCIGYVKGRYLLGKSAVKGIGRILTFPNPTSIGNIYSKKYYLLLASMIVLGFVVKYTTPDIRGAIDVIIGSALVNGAMVYFRLAATKNRECS